MYLPENSPKLKGTAEILSSNPHVFPVFNVLMTILTSVDARFLTKNCFLVLPIHVLTSSCVSHLLWEDLGAVDGLWEGLCLVVRMQTEVPMPVTAARTHGEELWQGGPDALVVKRSNLCIPVPGTYCCCQAPLY